MNKTIQLSEESHSSNVPNGRFDRKNKVGIKEICQKFENLSSAADTYTPVAPVRRKKSNHNVMNVKCSDNNPQDLKKIPAVRNDLSLKESYNPVSSSVKERSKLFESPVLNLPSSKLKKENNLLTSQMENSVTCQDKRSKKVENVNALCINTAPAKPPRSFLHLDLKTNNTSDENFKSNSVTNVTERRQSKSEMKIRISVSVEANTTEPIAKSSKLCRASEILPDNFEQSLQSTTKDTKSSKTQSLFNCLKNISSTANNIREKVKLKQSNIFVDLTPTTISPPKRYGTLKRSMSEEHIYAEPANVIKSDSNESKSSVGDPLHYMCTSLIPPAVPDRDKLDNRSVSSISVRSMIYGSFASLRAGSKENTDNTTKNCTADSSEADLSVKAIQDRIIYVKSVRKQVSSSSICLAPKLYEALFIVNIIENQPQVSHSFPLKVDAEYDIPLLPHICFPDSRLFKSVSVYHSEVFHFSLTDKNENTFGYCLRIQGWPEAGLNNSPLCIKLPVAICILSSFSASVFYRKLLLEIEKHLTLPRNRCFKYIRSLRKLGVPNAGASLSIPDISEQDNDDTKRMIISRPLDSHFVGFEMTRTLQLLDVDILVKCVASLFLERRILFFSASTSNLYQCCKAISSLLYPFEWPHQIIPVLPACLTIHCCSEQPYILGIVNNNCDSVLELLAEHELLIIDIDKGNVIKSCKDEDTILPRKVQKAVISALNLAKNMTDPTEMLRDIMISEAFVHMSVEMIGHYENHFTEVNENMTFQKESFLKNAFSHNIRSFLQWFSETQMFDSFIEDSLWRIKYRKICQTNLRTFFEKRVDEYKWELAHDSEKLSRIIGKTVRHLVKCLDLKKY